MKKQKNTSGKKGDTSRPESKELETIQEQYVNGEISFEEFSEKVDRYFGNSTAKECPNHNRSNINSKEDYILLNRFMSVWNFTLACFSAAISVVNFTDGKYIFFIIWGFLTCFYLILSYSFIQLLKSDN